MYSNIYVCMCMCVRARARVHFNIASSRSKIVYYYYCCCCCCFVIIISSITSINIIILLLRFHIVEVIATNRSTPRDNVSNSCNEKQISKRLKVKLPI